jgi:hypothetical protein
MMDLKKVFLAGTVCFLLICLALFYHLTSSLSQTSLGGESGAEVRYPHSVDVRQSVLIVTGHCNRRLKKFYIKEKSAARLSLPFPFYGHRRRTSVALLVFLNIYGPKYIRWQRQNSRSLLSKQQPFSGPTHLGQ